MRKFIINSVRGSTSIMEIECQKIFDPFLKSGEYKVKVITPASLGEKKLDGTFECPIYYWHGLFGTAEEAMDRVERDIRFELGRVKTKKISQDILKLDSIPAKEEMKKLLSEAVSSDEEVYKALGEVKIVLL